MRFQVNNSRKIYEAILIGCVVNILIYINFIGVRKYIIFIFLSIVILVYGLLYKSSGHIIIDNDKILVTNGSNNRKIYIKDILYIENCSKLNSAYSINGVGVSEEYYIVTNEDRYKIDCRFKNTMGNTLVEEIKNKYNKKIKVKCSFF